jgi:hypothetical protein
MFLNWMFTCEVEDDRTPTSTSLLSTTAPLTIMMRFKNSTFHLNFDKRALDPESSKLSEGLPKFLL